MEEMRNGNLKGRDYFSDLGEDGRIILIWNLDKQGVELPQMALVNTVMNLHVPEQQEIS
jgi:hypothetical protein